MGLKVSLLKEGLSGLTYYSKQLLEKIAEENKGVMYGELGYPDVTQVQDKLKRLSTLDLRRVALAYSNLRVEGDTLVADAKPLSTQGEKLLKEPDLLNFGIRALCQKEFDKEKGHMVIKEEASLKIISFDLIASENKEN